LNLSFLLSLGVKKLIKKRKEKIVGSFHVIALAFGAYGSSTLKKWFS
jgi:hypothetical protein